MQGRASVKTFDGAAPTVAPSGPAELGGFRLKVGPID
jgi:hypothetical protein